MPKSIIETAFHMKIIDENKKNRAEEYRKETNSPEDTALIDTKALTDDDLLRVYEKIYGYETVSEPEIEDDALALQFKRTTLTQYGFIPVFEKKRIRIYTSKPTELLYAEDLLRDQTGYKGSFFYSLISISNLNSLIENIFKEDSSEDSDIEIEGEEVVYDTYDVSEGDASQVVSLVNKLFREAIEAKASDVHLEPQDDGFYIRFRVDGTLKRVHRYPMNIAKQVTNRIKTMSNMDVNTSKILQDGNSRLEIFGKSVDLRSSIAPSLYGENLVVRILDQNKVVLDITMLGFSKENEEKFLKLITRPQGIILLTGPTGSGKSTSLYAAISELNTEDRCIITFEDPVEYRMHGIIQVQINPSMGVNFANALKAGLRQDIEVALVGEIRDPETAATAFDAANTGHLVFSTLHANTAVSSIARLEQKGVSRFDISRSLVGVINQRLAKRICPHCKEEYILPDSSPFRKLFDSDKEIKLYRGKGCKYCGGTGYSGRMAIQEFLVMDDDIRQALDEGANSFEIENIARRNGMKTIQEDGIEKALRGETTIEEVHRRVFFENI